jgi:hypothetical protein
LLFIRFPIVQWYITDLGCRQVDIPYFHRHIKWFLVFHFTVQHERTAVLIILTNSSA